MLSRLVIAFLPMSKHLLMSWFQSPSAVILEPKEIKSVTASTFSLSICYEVMGLGAMISIFLNTGSMVIEIMVMGMMSMRMMSIRVMSLGVVSMGMMSMGVVSMRMMSMGVVSMRMMSMGMMLMRMMSMGVVLIRTMVMRGPMVPLGAKGRVRTS